MGNLKSLVFLNAYEDTNTSNQAQHQNFRWTREITNASISNALSETFQIAPGATQVLFSGTRTLTQDGTTRYDLSLAPLSTSIYQLSYASGTAPGFRTLRTIGTDATSQITTSINGPVLTLTFSGGTLPSLGTVLVGDQILIGDDFNELNQGIFSIISLNTTSISIANPSGYVEGPITLGSDFSTQLRIFSGTGVQINDTLVITSGFSPVSWNSYTITQVTDYYVQFSYAGALPQESNILTQVAVYSMAKSFVYLETDQNLKILINGSSSGPVVQPLISNGRPYPGQFMLSSDTYSLSVVNTSVTPSNVTLLSTE